MFVKFLDGRRKGEVAEMKFADAQALIARGGAEKYPPNPRPTPIVREAREASAQGGYLRPAAQPKKKGKKR